MGCFVSDLEKMSSRELTGWQAYAKVNGLGPQTHDWYHARTQAILANYAEAMLYSQGCTRRQQQFQPQDFMRPRDKTDSQKLTAFIAGLQSLTRHSGGLNDKV